MSNSPQLREIFAAALGIESAADRQKYLDQACAGDAALREEVDSLLSAHGDAGSFMLEADPEATVQAPHIDDLVGETIGPYKLREQLGEGGFGVVYVAEQTEPVRRRVALKVIKPGMDTKEIIARFEAERQALALMDHPNIAKVLDAGATEQGRPYFVMELVKGQPITRFCDQQQLDLNERLKLFRDVCEAVQHAHQKGIIHRDIKPSNVLVTMTGEKPLVKVIDFGVAKALHQKLTDQTLWTSIQQVVGTPLYMSPEQADQAGAGYDIDTRTDVYSLGVLLYELLTGTTPFSREQLRQAGLDEIRRIIREEEPAKPSTRISTLKETLPSVAAVRKLEPRRLSAFVRGDLDWIVMKALEKDRERRYATPDAFADDIGRYLHHEPVEAGPPSKMYRFRKFARRNRLAFGTIAATIGALLVGVIGLSVANARIAEEQKQTEAALAVSDANLGKALAAIDRMLQRPSEVLMVSAGPTSVQITLLQEGLDLCEELAQDDPDDPRIRYQTARIQFVLCFRYAELGDIEKATEASQKAVTMLQRLREEDPHDPHYIFDLARAYCQFGDHDTDIEDGIEWHRKSVALLEDRTPLFPVALWGVLIASSPYC